MPKVQKAQNTKKGSRAIPLSVPSPQIPTQSNGHIAPLGLHSSPNILNSLGTNASDFFENLKKKGQRSRCFPSLLCLCPSPNSPPNLIVPSPTFGTVHLRTFSAIPDHRPVSSVGVSVFCVPIPKMGSDLFGFLFNHRAAMLSIGDLQGIRAGVRLVLDREKSVKVLPIVAAQGGGGTQQSQGQVVAAFGG